MIWECSDWNSSRASGFRIMRLMCLLQMEKLWDHRIAVLGDEAHLMSSVSVVSVGIKGLVIIDVVS
jgi:hypothetical protein